jgi:hypothetical protein
MRAARRPPALLDAALLLLLALGGCFEADAVLRPDGSGTLSLSYIPQERRATVASETERFTSPHVAVRALTPDARGVVVDLAFDDVTRLATARGLRELAVVRARRSGRERLRFVVRHGKVRRLREGDAPDVRIALTLPGPVRDARPAAAVEGGRVVWQVSVVEFFRRPSYAFSVTWAAAGAPPAS